MAELATVHPMGGERADAQQPTRGHGQPPRQQRGASAVTVRMAPWANPLELELLLPPAPDDGDRAVAWVSENVGANFKLAVVDDVETGVAGLAEGEEMMVVAAGHRTVDMRMVKDICWLAGLVYFFSVLGGMRRLGCPCGGALQRFFQLSPWLLILYLFVDNAVLDPPETAAAALLPMSIVPSCISVVLGRRVVCEPANRYVLRLVEMRARSHLWLSSQESNVGPTSLTFYTKVLVVFGILLLAAAAMAQPYSSWRGWVLALLLVPMISTAWCILICFQRWVACLGGHCHWWRRQVNAAIAAEVPADGASDLQGKLSHLHELLRQPFVQLNHLSTFVLLCETGLLFFAIGLVLRLAIGDYSGGGQVSNDMRILSIMVSTFFAVLFWSAVPGDEFQQVRSLLNSPDVLLGLEHHLGSVEKAEFVLARYFERLDLGFTLINVTLTTQRVLSLLASVVVTMIFVSVSLYNAFRSS